MSQPESELHIDEANLLSKCVGMVTQTHDDSCIYQLPFPENFAFKLVQGYGGTYSHSESSYYSLDFTMPTGTPVCAARSGAVVDVVDHFDAGGNDPALMSKWNVVKILHTDGSLGTYGHLKEGGATVREKQQIAAGEVIAYSGNTGWSGFPHLHFHVTDGNTRLRVPTNFTTIYSTSEVLQEGKWYARRQVSESTAKWQQLFSRLFLTARILKQELRGLQNDQKEPTIQITNEP